MEMIKVMPGLKQAGKFSHGWLKNHLAKSDYSPCQSTSSLWIHKTQPTSFTLVVDNFGMKYYVKQHSQNLINALQKKYVITVDLTGKKFLGLEIYWNYQIDTSQYQCRTT